MVMILRDVLAVAPDYSQAVNTDHRDHAVKIAAVLLAALSYLIYVCALL